MIKRYSDKEIEILKSNYKTIGNVELGKMINRSADSIKNQMNRLNLKRTKEEVLMLRRKPNKGQFKSGALPHNTKFNGHRRITKDGYVEVRISLGNYQLEHLYRWERINGKLPKGCCLKSIDDNKLNTNPNNWRLISRAENMYRNAKHNYPEEIIPSLVLLNKLNQKIQEHGTK